MKYVYLLESLSHPKETMWAWRTICAPARCPQCGSITHTAKFKPWRLVIYIAFSDEAKAVALSDI